MGEIDLTMIPAEADLRGLEYYLDSDIKTKLKSPDAKFKLSQKVERISADVEEEKSVICYTEEQSSADYSK